MGLYKTETLEHSKGNGQQSSETFYRIIKEIFVSHLTKVNTQNTEETQKANIKKNPTKWAKKTKYLSKKTYK